MTRLINPAPQFLDGNGNPIEKGLLYFFEAGTSTFKTTYNDAEETIANTNPVTLDAAGRVPTIFYSGLSRVVLKDASGNQIFDRDNVGSGEVFAQFSSWLSFVSYNANDFVFKNGKLYQSRANANQNNDPESSPGANANWLEIRFLDTYDSTVTYAIGDVVRTSGGLIWHSVVNGNLNNNPINDAGLNWLPAIDGSKVAEIIALDERTTTCILQTGGGSLTALRVNSLEDGSTYTLPLANTVNANQWIDIELSDENKALQPTVQRAGTDNIAYSGGTDTSIIFDSGASIALRLYSNGSNEWRF